jgi:hypothetical protein
LGENALKDAQQYRIESIADEWDGFFERLARRKSGEVARSA